MNQLFFTLGAISGAISVALGAFGAHALRKRVSEDRLGTYQTGVQYEMYHALALVGVALAAAQRPASAWVGAAGWLFVAGTLLFSGSLYLLVLTGRRFFGAITPLGGVAFIAGWICLALMFRY